MEKKLSGGGRLVWSPFIEIDCSKLGGKNYIIIFLSEFQLNNLSKWGHVFDVLSIFYWMTHVGFLSLFPLHCCMDMLLFHWNLRDKLAFYKIKNAEHKKTKALYNIKLQK